MQAVCPSRSAWKKQIAFRHKPLSEKQLQFLFESRFYRREEKIVKIPQEEMLSPLRYGNARLASRWENAGDGLGERAMERRASLGQSLRRAERQMGIGKRQQRQGVVGVLI